MKKYIGHTACFLLFLLIILAPGTVRASQKADLTLMVYMCGSNLESGRLPEKFPRGVRGPGKRKRRGQRGSYGDGLVRL